ncbi:TonB-dependent receptor [Paraflavisolibacter sp. H34]|uniref:TonB-dependent receptor plug domain-containing protein n=1 Tax=Huijunlia imazamoxiresistens TaxID=3127457 RepID=UPI00301AA411
MKKPLHACLFILLAAGASAQDSLTPKSLDEVLIYSGKFSEHRKYVVQKVDLITDKDIAALNAQNTGDLLIHTGNVFVQKSQQGGSSPVLRGFEASRILLVVDGIRMNNAIYRAGHLQNVITVDQNMLERVEVLYGPASTLYGSDALGGAILMRTKAPQLAQAGKLKIAGSAFTRYSSANGEKTGHIDLNLGGKKWAWLQAYNFSDFGDMKVGRNDPDDYPGFGKRPYYVASVNGIDSVVRNNDDRVQRFSGYRQWDGAQKLLFRPSENVAHLLNLQYSSSTDVPRYDRLQDVRNGSLRYAQWYYGPQQRALAAYELSAAKPLFFDEGKLVASYQHLEESRHTREYRRYDRLDHRWEALEVAGLTVDGRKRWQTHELTLGADAQLNWVQSTAQRENLLTGARSKLDSRYPDGDNRMNYFGVYAQHLVKLAGGKLILNDGLRLQAVQLRAEIRDNSFFNFPFTDIEQNNTAVTANAGAVFLPSPRTRFTAGIASGFRAPNIDDLARIFESNSASRQLIVPNPDIRPEYTWTFDGGYQQLLGKVAELEFSGFYTRFSNAIVLAPFAFNKQDSILYNGSMSKVFANQNAHKAFLYGLRGGFRLFPAKAVEVYATANYQYGRIQKAGGDLPLDHIPPVHGKAGIRWKGAPVEAELYTLFNGWKKLKDYNPTGEDNAAYATPDGMPAWATLNAKVNWKLHAALTLQAGVENILDRNYRYFASGFSAPGRNVMVALRAGF